MEEKRKQNNIASTYFESSDLAEREDSILAYVVESTGFKPVKLLGRSSFWGSHKIGAFHYAGEFEGKEAVLKVQGIKPTTSEIYMLNSFEHDNKSAILRPPYLYSSIPWDDAKRYEALIMEDVKGEKVISYPSDEREVTQFFELYQDYKKNCLQQPWIDKPEITISEGIEQNFAKWLKASEEVYPDHPHRKSEDAGIIKQAYGILVEGYKSVESEFQHGHFSADDLYKVEDKIVLLSNLYWSWRAPLYDAVFAYHWYIYTLANTVDGLTPEDIDNFRNLWLSKIETLPQTQGNNTKFLELALLERETAGLVMDALTVDPNKPISEYVVNSTRQRVLELIHKLKDSIN
jgi:hypothetical protein